MIPGERDIMIRELLKKPDHVINSESFLIEARGVLRRFDDVNVAVYDRTAAILSNLAKEVEYNREKGFRKSYLTSAKEDRIFEELSAEETIVLVDSRAKVEYRISDLRDRLDFLAGTLKAKGNYEKTFFSMGFFIGRWTYTFR
jgi:hypothetical protein